VLAVGLALAKAPQSSAGALAQSHCRTCYKSVADAMTDIYGVDYDSDNNIFQEKAIFENSEMLLSGDRTSGTNASRTIFEKQKSGAWCVVLISPPVASLVPVVEENARKRPTRWKTTTQASPGYPAIQVVYVWSKKAEAYKPAQCFLESSGKKRTSINCPSAYN
jgi:hypothetical protein